MKIRIITIGGQEYGLPTDLTPADLTKLIGILAQLRPIDTVWMYGHDTDGHVFCQDYARISLGERTIEDRESAMARKTAAKAKEDARVRAKEETK